MNNILPLFHGRPQAGLGDFTPAIMDREEYNLYSAFIDECFTLNEHGYITQILEYTPPDTWDDDVEMVDSDFAKEIPEVSDIASDEVKSVLMDDGDALLIEEILPWFDSDDISASPSSLAMSLISGLSSMVTSMSSESS